MTLPENDYQILKLLPSFYAQYPNPPYVELMKKESRRYTCLLFQSHYDYFICIPFRSNVNHPYAYHFRKSARSRHSHSALDYTKIVILNNTLHLDKVPGYVDKDEYLETLRNIERIKEEALEYVETYVNQSNGQSIIHPKEFTRRYSKSSLQYFHNELGIYNNHHV